MPLGLGLGLTGGGNAMGSPFYGLSFDGGDYIAQTSTDLNTYTTGCMEAWVYFDTFGRVDCLLGDTWKQDIDGNSIGFVASSGGIITAEISDGVAVAVFQHIIGGSPANVWIHIALSWDRNGNMAAFLNGVQIGVNQDITAITGDVSQLGEFNLSKQIVAGRLVGRMTGVRLWNVFRSAAEITSTMNTPLLGPTSGLVLEWPMLPGSGTTVADNSGNSNTATFPGGANNPTWIGPYRRLTSGGPA
jgi:hypothetical protein